MEGVRGMSKYKINYALYLAHYDSYFHINDNAKKLDIFVSQIILFSFFIHLNCSHKSLPCHGYTNKNQSAEGAESLDTKREIKYENLSRDSNVEFSL